MKKVIMFMSVSLLTIFSIGCSSDDGGGAPIIEPPIETDYEKFIQNEWAFMKYQLLDKDRKVVFELDAKGADCKNNLWIFKETLDENKDKIKVRTDYTYVQNPDTDECEEHKKTMPYSINDKELVTALLNDGDQMMVYFFEIHEMRKNKMLLIRKDYELTEEEAVLYGFPKEAKYLQYELKTTK
ncbi:hypothetical protein [Myroides marinus]|uniref:hypothetical protein n=1 Tax=Myroides marinus TaxID=703342 RepID=UPI002576DD34|nr:hypothetical protein [Myroides marinus]MDM1380068.1 hypothetical protein [Myroides marinus]MDM1387375.1 hypothetical protein [Myroides marinus]MDM1394552.1 hypothetical protein [Myroides marinus]MDM1404043.1 hypothetical protein [Myroides marinus]